MIKKSEIAGTGANDREMKKQTATMTFKDYRKSG